MYKQLDKCIFIIKSIQNDSIDKINMQQNESRFVRHDRKSLRRIEFNTGKSECSLNWNIVIYHESAH